MEKITNETKNTLTIYCATCIIKCVLKVSRLYKIQKMENGGVIIGFKEICHRKQKPKNHESG